MSELREKVVKLIEEYRARCLWFLREDYVPVTPEEIGQTLELIERYGDRASYLRAEELKQWLLHDSSAMSSSC
jgi:hypothetical protein